MIIKNVPFIGDKKEEYASCQGPPTVMMILKFFDIDVSFSELYKRMRYKKGKWFFEMYIVELLSSFGINSKYHSSEDLKKIGNDEEELKKVGGPREEVDVEHYDSSVDFVLKNNLFEKREVTLDFIKSQIEQKKLVIAVINRNILTRGSGYKGHFILIKGFDESNFICNDSYLGENLKISFEKFKEVFYYPGIDEDNKEIKTYHIVVIG
ncbi:C39 family peptidase [Candidatus Woesearchaeota archaeon]|nr:C39 family peptidase [Candidatus Woesearchaeota archaeon]